ncbi:MULTISPECIES: hypothetical protein [Salegentibacter]|uniref:Phage integrase SAM-like domain-containing protein n=1 Tax=Salegentibacter maritimus TaxID=2794347 RepID=A0ABS0TE06_9FLAO|nr:MULTISPECIES: hypothetical protein [Salegentibacter]MBE7640756.1 hypothetical protein [Salegentibacter sp. BLCTC]MBI6117139.1 hypothetical protein [Salegentibacter maritimus]MBI6119284.1 hypothetical protein [Salegentibacter maritimus]
MKLNPNPDTTLDDFKSLISHSIFHLKSEKNSNYTILHRAIIKKYFDAKNVQINYKKHTVDLQIPVGKRKYTGITFECQDLERFLKSCLKKDKKSILFYQEALSHYNIYRAA